MIIVNNDGVLVEYSVDGSVWHYTKGQVEPVGIWENQRSFILEDKIRYPYAYWIERS
jgi:hypothetical protein